MNPKATQRQQLQPWRLKRMIPIVAFALVGTTMIRMGLFNVEVEESETDRTRSLFFEGEADKVPIGSMGPAGSGRENMKYYDELYYLAKEYAPKANSVLEVGCSVDPFVKHLYWVPQKQCVAPYSAYGDDTKANINITVADFSEWDPKGKRYDVLICSQVVEHILDARQFVQKFFEVADVVIMSVPYKWPRIKSHKHHGITKEKIKKWADPHIPMATSIVKDGDFKRIIAVFNKKDPEMIKYQRLVGHQSTEE